MKRYVKPNDNGVQKDMFGNTVHMLNVKETYRMVKCGLCKRTVKMSEAKTRLSFGKTLTICNDCLSKKAIKDE